MLNVKNKRMNSLKEEIECSKGHLLYLIDVHIFSKVLQTSLTTTLVLTNFLFDIDDLSPSCGDSGDPAVRVQATARVDRSQEGSVLLAPTPTPSPRTRHIFTLVPYCDDNVNVTSGNDYCRNYEEGQGHQGHVDFPLPGLKKSSDVLVYVFLNQQQ